MLGKVIKTNYHRYKLFLPVKLKSGRKLIYMFELFKHYNIVNRELYGILINEKYKNLLDVGANIGTISYFFLDYHPGRKSILIEPQKECCEHLRKVFHGKNAQIYNVGAGNKRSRVPLYKKKAFDGDASMIPSGYFLEKPDRVETVSVIPIDELVIGNIDLIKIDIEGFEVEAITGMKKLITKNKPDIIFESHNEKQLEKIKNLLSEIGRFKIRQLDCDNYFAEVCSETELKR